MIELTLPWPPSVNNYWKPSKQRGGMYITAHGLAFRKAVHDCVLDQLGKYPKIPHMVSICVEAFPPTRRHYDIDNGLKALLDSITKAGVWLDDNQVEELYIIRRDTIAGMVKVFITLTRDDDGQIKPARNLTNAEVEELRKLHDEGWGYMKLAQKFEIPWSTARDIAKCLRRVRAAA
jgi:crossover junction endodeoxyribonuclease RusA